MAKVWEELKSYTDVQPGDTVGISSSPCEIVTVVKVSRTGHITTTTKSLIWDSKARDHIPQKHRYFVGGRENGAGSSFYNRPCLVGTKTVEKSIRTERYGSALHQLEQFVGKLKRARSNSGYSYRDRAEPITREEYTEIARLSKACLDDGWGDERPRTLCIECFADTSRDRPHDKACSRRPPDPIPDAPAVPDGTCPGCGKSGDEHCTPECETQSNPAPYNPAAAEGGSDGK